MRNINGTLSVLAIVAMLVPQPMSAQTVPAPDPLQGDGRVSDFYRWDSAIPTKPGTLLRSEPLPTIIGLPGASSQTRLLYSSTDGVGGNASVVVSGALFEPEGTPPHGGWPLIAWAHGTVGIADICAPSWAGRSYRDIAYLKAWLDQGYAIVATDYQGLGTPGPHPYLNVRAEAYGVLDAVRAALASHPRIANKIVIVGQSQGAGAAFGAASYAPQYAPQLNVLGTVATGVPYLKPGTQMASSKSHAVDPALAYIFWLVLNMQQTDLTLSPSDLLTPTALPVFETARFNCVYEVESDISILGLSDAAAERPALAPALTKHLAEFEFPTVLLKQPVFIGIGTADVDVTPSMQEQLVKDACAAGSIVEAHLYKGLTHSQTFETSLRDSMPFVRKMFAGEPVTPVCSPKPE